MPIDLGRLQSFVSSGITQSAVRLGRRSVAGMGVIAREYCSAINLERLPAPLDYPKKLDRWTDELKSQFPTGGRYWGTARKCINIFMRDANYNIHLRRAYPLLGNLENVLEVPLDSYVAKGLLNEPEATEPLRLGAIIRLTPYLHGRFQHLAQKVADRKKVARVDLDTYYFRQD